MASLLLCLYTATTVPTEVPAYNEAAGYGASFDEMDFDLPPIESWLAPLADFAAL